MVESALSVRIRFVIQFCFIIILASACWLASLGFPAPIHAEKLVFSENFDQNFSNWIATRDDGRYWSVVNGQLQVNIGKRFTVTELVPSDSVWDPAWRNILYQFELTPYSGVDKNVSFNVRDSLNYYGLHFAYGMMHIAKIKNGAEEFASSHPVTLKNNTVYAISILFQNGTISVAIDGDTIATVHDATFSPADYGKIGLLATTGAAYPTKVGFDNVRVYDLDHYGVSVPEFKQSDPAWSDTVYDHALEWSLTPSINSWGCALTSLAMIMNAHGITQMANGEVLNPASLNQWLVDQPDGYVGGGLVNFMAAMRLTKQLSDLYNTPALEYGRINYDATVGNAPAAAEITADRPVIVQIPGHFLVADGVVGAGEDLLIKDPAFAYTQLSQHASAPLSFRTFQPSYTDLSYLLLTADQATSLTVTLPNNSDAPPPIVESLVAYNDSLNPTDPEVIAPVSIWSIAQPTDGRYIVTVTNSEAGPFTIPVFRYQVDGSVVIDEITGVYTNRPLLFALDILPSQPLNIRPIATFSSWQNLAKLQFEHHQFAEPKVWLWLNYYAQAALNSESHSQYYPLILQRVLNWYQPLMEPSAYNLLESELQLIEN